RHVAGSGDGAYMQLSGTSMSAGFVSGAVALLLEQRPSLRPADAKAVLQLTSSFLASAGLVGAGAGEVNVLAAVQFVDGDGLRYTTIAEERIKPIGLSTAGNISAWIRAEANHQSSLGSNTIVWSDTI